MTEYRVVDAGVQDLLGPETVKVVTVMHLPVAFAAHREAGRVIAAACALVDFMGTTEAAEQAILGMIPAPASQKDGDQ